MIEGVLKFLFASKDHKEEISPLEKTCLQLSPIQSILISFSTPSLPLDGYIEFVKVSKKNKFEISPRHIRDFFIKEINQKILTLSFSVPKGNHLPPV